MGKHTNRITFSLLLLALAGPVSAATWHVPADFPTVEAAIDSAQSGDTIRIAPGIHAGPVRLFKELTLVGDVDDPESVVLLTDQFSAGTSAGVVLRGLTISGNGNPMDGLLGESVEFTDCVIADLTDDGQWGFILLFADAVFERCTIRNNRALAVFETVGETAVEFRQCRFLHNVGRGLLQFHAGDVLLYQCLFQDNHSTGHGGAVVGNDGMVVDSCRFENNSATGQGGAFYSNGDRDSRIVNSTFIGNHAADGGAVSADQTVDLWIENTDFEGNTASVSGPQGYIDGGEAHLTCCLVDPLLWAGGGEVIIHDEDCTVAAQVLPWGGLKSLFR